MALNIPSNPPPHIARMVAEGDELNARMSKLVAFMDNGTFAELDPQDQVLLRTQFSIMQAYLNVLSIRLGRAYTESHDKGLIKPPGLIVPN